VLRVTHCYSSPPHLDTIEVVGTIHKNPDLLTV